MVEIAQMQQIYILFHIFSESCQYCVNFLYYIYLVCLLKKLLLIVESFISFFGFNDLYRLFWILTHYELLSVKLMKSLM